MPESGVVIEVAAETVQVPIVSATEPEAYSIT
jgi:hypothetical protein